jgi:hypothetical protein
MEEGTTEAGDKGDRELIDRKNVATAGSMLTSYLQINNSIKEE